MSPRQVIEGSGPCWNLPHTTGHAAFLELFRRGSFLQFAISDGSQVVCWVRKDDDLVRIAYRVPNKKLIVRKIVFVVRGALHQEGFALAAFYHEYRNQRGNRAVDRLYQLVKHGMRDFGSTPHPAQFEKEAWALKSIGWSERMCL